MIKIISLGIFFSCMQMLAMNAPSLPTQNEGESDGRYLSRLVNYSIKHNQTDGLADIIKSLDCDPGDTNLIVTSILETEHWYNDQRIDVPKSIEDLKILLTRDKEK